MKTNCIISLTLNSYKRAFLLILLLALVVPSASGRSRTRNEALSAARTFLQKEKPSVAARSLAEATSFTIAYTCTDSSSSPGNALYYIVNTGNNNGFIIVSGDDRAKEILGYSDGGSFSQQHMPDDFRVWLGIYEQELKALALLPEGDPSASPIASAKAKTQSTATNAFATSVEPLLADIAWDQSAPYNIMCPNTDSAQCITGCVATAMAQVMRYHQWPITGIGSKTYKPKRLDDSLSVDF
ncbi:MAG: C10 family peptidase, partial [Bacteroidales bacterium]|nr:C10 family peptidase [Bacteroidales bacterium]